jgi:transcriptional regulator with XRE-family HTH domain
MHLSEYMTANGLSDETVAAAIGVSRVTVSRIRRRKVRPDWPTIAKLKEFSGGQMSADDFERIEATPEGEEAA